MSKRATLIAGRLFFALLALAAIITQFAIHLHHGFDAVNFFSYFTNLSNIFFAIMLLVGAVFLIRRREPTITGDLIRGAAVVAMAVVGLVYFALLRDEDLGTLLPWVNVVVHMIMPVVAVADWLYEPPKTPLTVRHLGFWLIYPLLYLIYTLIRGAVVGFYPYPFLNPAKVGGAGVVMAYCLAIFVVFLLIGWLVIALGNRPKAIAATLAA